MIIETCEPQIEDSADGDLNRSLLVLAKVALRVLSILPHAANVERLFSELGRFFSSARIRMKPPQSENLVVVAEDYRVTEKEKQKEGGKPSDPKNRRISKTSNVRQLLRQVDDGDVSILVSKASTAPSPAFHPVLPPFSSSTSRDSGGPSREGQVVNLDSDDEEEEEGEPDGEEILAHDLSEDLTGEASDATQQDAEVTEMATSNFSGFISALEGIMAADEEDGDSDCDLDAPISTLSEMTATADFLDRFPLGELPSFNDKSVTHTHPTGDRAWKAKLCHFFDQAKVGRLASMTKIGAAQCS